MRDNSSRTPRRFQAPHRWPALLFLGALLASAGCEESTPQAAPSATADAAKAQVAPSGPITALSAPADVVVYGGVDDAVALTEKLNKAYPALGPTVDPKVMSTAFVERYKLTDPSVIDLKKPIRFAIIDPKTHTDPMVLMVPTAGKEAFEKALPASKKKDDAGNAWSLQASGRTAYVNMIDDWAVFTGSPDAFKSHRDFLVKLLGATLSQPAALVVDVEHVMKLYKGDLTKGLESVKEQMAGQPGAGGAMSGIGELMKGFVDVAQEADKVVVVLAPLEDGALLKADIYPKKDSDLAKAFTSLGEQKLDLLDKAPKDAPLVAAWSMDPDGASGLAEGLWRWSLQFMGGEKTDPKYAEAMTAYWKATDGDVLAVAREGEKGLEFSMIFGVRDADKAREAQKTLRGLYDEPALKERYKKMGIEMTYKADAYKVGEVSVSTMTSNLTQGGGLAKLGPAGSLFSDMLTQHLAISDELGVVAYGADGKTALTAWLEGKVEGGFAGTDAAKKALENAAPGTFMVVYGQAGPLAKAFAGGEASDVKPAARGLVLSAGAKGGVLHIVLDVPQAQVAAIKQALGGLGTAL